MDSCEDANTSQTTPAAWRYVSDGWRVLTHEKKIGRKANPGFEASAAKH
jgi:hypothetical protein